jgi:hypothetical protein
MSSQEQELSSELPMCILYIMSKELTVTLNSDTSSLEIDVFLHNYALPEIYRTFRDV